MSDSSLRNLIFLLPPGAILTVLLPVVLSASIAVFHLEEPLDPWFLVFLFVYFLSLSAFFFYSRVITTQQKKRDIKSPTMLLVTRLSFVVGIFTSIYAVIEGYMMPFLSVTALVSAILCSVAFYCFEK